MSSVIGILGGMGPRATVEFEQRLIHLFVGNDQAIPTIITINDGSIPDRTEFLTKKGADPVPRMRVNARKLLQLGVTVICMPCNTAHAGPILNELQGTIPLPLIDMPSATLLEAVEQGSKKVLILGTDGTKVSKVFEHRTRDLECLYPNKAGQQLLMEIIECLKRGGKINDNDFEQLQNLIHDASCDAIILACTELSMLKNRLADFNIIDSLDALAAQCHKWVTTRYTKQKGGTDHDTRHLHFEGNSIASR